MIKYVFYKNKKIKRNQQFEFFKGFETISLIVIVITTVDFDLFVKREIILSKHTVCGYLFNYFAYVFAKDILFPNLLESFSYKDSAYSVTKGKLFI